MALEPNGEMQPAIAAAEASVSIPPVTFVGAGRRSRFLSLSILTVAVLLSAAIYVMAIRPRQSIVDVGACVAGQPCASTPVPDEHNQEGIPYSDVVRISQSDAKSRFDAGRALFVHVRDSEAHARAHIPNSLSLPLDELETRIPALTRDAEIITYCT